MKLLLCLICEDVIRLPSDKQEISCNCGETKGKYLDSLNAEYSGKNAIPLGFDNSSLVRAVQRQPESGIGYRFEAFVIPRTCDTFRRVE